MWVPGSLAYLVPLFVIGVRLLFGASETPRRGWIRSHETRSLAQRLYRVGSRCPSSASPLLRVEPAAFDLLRVPLLGRFLRWRHARLCLQVPAPAPGRAHRLRWLPRAADRRHEPGGRAALDSLARPGGPGVAGGRQRLLHGLPVHAAADARRRWLPQGRELAALAAEQMAGGRACSSAFLWAYEAFALWDSPWWTAWIVLAYFAAAFVIDGFFRGASFCKYVCPIGQFNFVQSLDFAAGSQGARSGRLRIVPDQGLHPRERRRSRMRARPVPAPEVEQHGLHVLPRLYPRLPARQHRHPCRAAREGIVARFLSLGHRPVRQAP